MTRYFSIRIFLPCAVIFAAVFFFASGVIQKTFYEVPILMYHRVNDFSELSALAVSPKIFERQMEFLKLHRYRVTELSTLIQWIKTGQKIPSKTVVITFDDGYQDNFQHAFPVLKKMNFPATIFMISSNVNEPEWLSEEDLRILDEAQIMIGSHTAHHAFLPNVSLQDAKIELVDSKKELEKILGHPVTLFSYPAGGLTGDIERQVKEIGYQGAVTTNYQKNRHNPYALHRIKISNSSGNLFNFWIKLSGYYHLGKKRVMASGSNDKGR